MALLMIPHTFFIPYALEISFYQSSNMILQPPYELDRTGIINALFTYGGNRGLETGSDPRPSPQLAKLGLERTETSSQGSFHLILMPPGMRNLGNVMEMGGRIQSQRPLNSTSSWPVYKPCPPPNVRLELKVWSKTGWVFLVFVFVFLPASLLFFLLSSDRSA